MNEANSTVNVYYLSAYVALASLAIGIVPGLIHSPPYTIWYSLVILGSYAGFNIGLLARYRFPRVRLILEAALFYYALYVCLLTIIAAVPSWVPFILDFRPELWFGNANILAASLTISVTAAIAMRYTAVYRDLPYLIIALGFIATLLTGSRTAVIGLIAAIISYAVRFALKSGRSQRGVILLAVLAIVCVFVIIVPLNVSSPPTVAKNYIVPSQDLRSSSWYKDFAQSIHITPIESADSHPSGTIHRVQAKSSPDPKLMGMLLVFSLPAPPEGSRYVTSVYLRSDNTDAVVLSSNFTRTTCPLSSVWSRCVAPVAEADGIGAMQFQLRTVSPGDAIDIELSSPQIEEGEIATQVENTSATPLSELRNTGILRRYSPVKFYNDLVHSRHLVFQAALNDFRSSPWLGVASRVDSLLTVGASQRESTKAGFLPATGDEVGSRGLHAHNLVLEHLASTGIIGLTGLLIMILGSALVSIRSSGWAILPIVIVVTVLNAWDYTFFHFGSFYIFWLVLGLGSGDASHGKQSVAV